MSRTIQRRGAQVLGSAAIFMLAVSGPAMARPDEASVTQRGSSAAAQISDEQYNNECHYLGKCTGAPGDTKRPGPGPSAGNGYDVEYLQLGAGVLAGIGLGGAAVAVASRRRHGHAALPA